MGEEFSIRKNIGGLVGQYDTFMHSVNPIDDGVEGVDGMVGFDQLVSSRLMKEVSVATDFACRL